MESRSQHLFVVLLVLLATSTIVLVVEDRAEHSRNRHAEAFHHLVGGLGFGPALDLSGCAFSFDPRLDDSCAYDCGPLPGGACFCPRHAGSIFYCSPHMRGVRPGAREKDDGLSP